MAKRRVATRPNVFDLFMAMLVTITISAGLTVALVLVTQHRVGGTKAVPTAPADIACIISDDSATCADGSTLSHDAPGVITIHRH